MVKKSCLSALNTIQWISLFSHKSRDYDVSNTKRTRRVAEHANLHEEH